MEPTIIAGFLMFRSEYCCNCLYYSVVMVNILRISCEFWIFTLTLSRPACRISMDIIRCPLFGDNSGLHDSGSPFDAEF